MNNQRLISYYVVEWMSAEDCDIKQHQTHSIDTAAKWICDQHETNKFFVYISVEVVGKLTAAEEVELSSKMVSITQARLGDYYEI